MTREEFIADHLRTCEASPVPKYDPANPAAVAALDGVGMFAAGGV